MRGAEIYWFNEEAFPKKDLMLDHLVRFWEVGQAEDFSAPFINLFNNFFVMILVDVSRNTFLYLIYKFIKTGKKQFCS